MFCLSETVWSTRTWWLLSSEDCEAERPTSPNPVSEFNPVRVEPVQVPAALGTWRVMADPFLLGSPRKSPIAFK